MSTEPVVACLAPDQEGRMEVNALNIGNRVVMEGGNGGYNFTVGSESGGNGFVKSSKKKGQ